MKWLLIGAWVLGAALLAADVLVAPWVVRSEVVASLLSPGGLTLVRAAAALGYVALHLLAVFLGPALVLGAVVGLGVDLIQGRVGSSRTPSASAPEGPG